MSVKIRERLAAARKRYHSNDNIADFLEPGDLEALLDEVEIKMQGVLDSLVIDTDNDHNTGNTALHLDFHFVEQGLQVARLQKVSNIVSGVITLARRRQALTDFDGHGRAHIGLSGAGRRWIGLQHAQMVSAMPSPWQDG